MKSHATRVHLIPCFFLVLLFAGNAVYANQVAHYRSKDNSASASFGFPDASGCIWTSIDISVVESMKRFSVENRSFEAYMILSLYIYDKCNGGQRVFSGFSEQSLERGVLAFKGNLGGATVSTETALYDWVSGTTRTVEIDLAWTGVGEIWTGRRRESYLVPGYRQTTRYFGSNRSAEVFGTLLLDGAAIPAGTATTATLYNTRDGSIEIRRER